MKFRDFKSFVQFVDPADYQIRVICDGQEYSIMVARESMADFFLRDARSNTIRTFKSLDSVARVLAEAGITEWRLNPVEKDQLYIQGL